MARIPVREGGWFKLWSKKWLNDDTLKKIGDTGEVAYLRALCLAGVLLNNGLFIDILENPLAEDQICKMARISPEQFRLLLDSGLIIRKDGFYYIKNWEKHQNPSQKARESQKNKENLASSPVITKKEVKEIDKGPKNMPV